MKTLDEILALESEAEKIYYLQQRRTPLPDVHALYKDWDPDKHDVNDVDKRPENKIIVAEATIDPSTGKEIPARILMIKRIRQTASHYRWSNDITNIHTAWTVGKDPKVTCEPNNDKEQELLSIIKSTCRRNKMRYFNKRLVRSWLSETECAEYWYVVKDESFWRRLLTKLKNTFGGRVMPQYRLKCALWSHSEETNYIRFSTMRAITSHCRVNTPSRKLTVRRQYIS